MRKPPALARITSAAALALLCSGSFAQDTTGWKLQCQFVGNSGQPEPLGDREGHAISVGEHTCRTEGGPMDGAVLTSHAVWEWDKDHGQLRAGMTAGESNGCYQEQIGRMKPLMSGPPVLEHCDVGVQA